MHVRKLPILILALGWAIGLPIPADAMNKQFKIKLTGKNAEFDTRTGLTTIHGHAVAGLVSASERNGQTLLRYWQSGAFRETVKLDDMVLIDGTDVADTSRVTGFRLARDGSFAYLRMTKGSKARVALYQDNQVVSDWARGHLLRIVSFDRNGLIYSKSNGVDPVVDFYRLARGADGRLVSEAVKLGTIKNCAVQSARKRESDLLLQVYCSHETGSDVVSMDLNSGAIAPISVSEYDEHFGSTLQRSSDGVSVLQVTGNENGRRAFQAVSGIFQSLLGEPWSRASDEAGTQSWGQSYRLRTLAILAKKTGHPVFAALAKHSISQTLAQRNETRFEASALNPSCGWASRIYSANGKDPISFLVNQAMISSSLISACEDLGAHCPTVLRRQVLDNAQCLVRSFERDFDLISGLYRIPYAAPFRFDGIWAPWNWQMSFAPVLEAVGNHNGEPELVFRAHQIAMRFLDTWQLSDGAALWRYWTPEFYQGWDAAQRVSQNRPIQRKQAPRRFEDVSHAGISLLGLQALKLPRESVDRQAVAHTIDRILNKGVFVARDLDGAGPRSSRWLPGGGFAAFASERMASLYSRNLPGANSGDQLLAFANLIELAKPVDVHLRLMNCVRSNCTQVRSWHMESLMELIEQNPLFSIEPYSLQK